MLKLKLITEV